MTAIVSYNPATGQEVARVAVATDAHITQTVDRVCQAQLTWSQTSFEYRQSLMKQLQAVLSTHKQALATLLSQENGKVYTESVAEITASIKKIDHSIEAVKTRAWPTQILDAAQTVSLMYKPLGVGVVLGPFNFPFYLPLGQIIPALLTGNTLVFKPSEHTPSIGQRLVACFEEAGFPPDVIRCIQGYPDQGQTVIGHHQCQAVYFTGSYQAGRAISRQLADRPEVLLALECGGNNPLIVSSYQDVQRVVECIVTSAFLTSGQRCTCARRLIVIDSAQADGLLAALVLAVKQLTVGAYDASPVPTMGPLISEQACEAMLAFGTTLQQLGATTLVPVERLDRPGYFVTPGLYDVPAAQAVTIDTECFGPLLQVIRVASLQDAIKVANHTQYGLAASLISTSAEEFKQVYHTVKAGLIHWNRPTNGADPRHPFGGVGYSGNYRPVGSTAVDACVYPVSSIQPHALL